MSQLVVEVCEVSEIKPHSNAERLEIARIKGWDVIVQKDLVKVGDPVVYFPPDSVLTEELADRLGIRKYLASVKNPGEPDRYRVKAARLRGLPSYGTIDHEVPEGLKVGDDVAELFGVTKWEPPARGPGGGGPKNQGRRAPDAPNFHKYCDPQHLRNHPGAFEDGDEVVISEKLHGSNVRVGKIRHDFEPGDGVMGFFRRLYKAVFKPAPTYKFVAGSRETQRRLVDEKGRKSDFATPLDDPGVVRLLDHLCGDERDVILYGELVGVQDMKYGCKDGELKSYAFDVKVDGRYLDAYDKLHLFEEYGVPAAPVLYVGPFSWDVVESLTDGPTTVCEPHEAGPFKGREGVVVTSIREPEVGRKVFKSVSADYLARKNGTDGH